MQYAMIQPSTVSYGTGDTQAEALENDGEKFVRV